jgi:3-isopropylmalate dehydrogenase
MASRSIRLAVVAGDGIGPEVVAEGLKVLDVIAPAHGLTIEPTPYDLGAARWHRTGETLPDAVLEEIRAHDVILLGAVGDPTVPSGVLERGLLLKLRFELDHYVNLRPVKLFPGVAAPLAGVRPEDIDMVVVREGTEGPYTGVGGVMRRGTPHEVATQESVNTAYGVERVVRYAFEKAASRPRQKLTLVHKDNVLTFAGDLYQRTVHALAKEFPAVSVDYSHVDAASMFFVTQPQRFDVVVTDNLFGDILTDLGAAIAGGIGLAASGNINPSAHGDEHGAPSMFEPVHGSAPDIAGQGTADPTATILSVAMLLDHIGVPAAAAAIEQAVADDLVERQGAWVARSTREIGDDIAERVAP